VAQLSPSPGSERCFCQANARYRHTEAAVESATNLEAFFEDRAAQRIVEVMTGHHGSAPQP
jgi:hypothetical protein